MQIKLCVVPGCRGDERSGRGQCDVWFSGLLYIVNKFGVEVLASLAATISKSMSFNMFSISLQYQHLNSLSLKFSSTSDAKGRRIISVRSDILSGIHLIRLLPLKF